MLLFWPWFVECAFQQHYHRTTLGIADAVCLPLDVLIWIACMFSGGRMLDVACALPPMLVALAITRLRHRQPELYTRRRTALTALRRASILPFLSLVLLRRPLHITGSWAAAAVHLLVLSGGLHSLIASFFFLNSWWTAMCEAVLTAVVLGSAAPAACANMLAGPQPHAGWRAAAGEQGRLYTLYAASSSRQHACHVPRMFVACCRQKQLFSPTQVPVLASLSPTCQPFLLPQPKHRVSACT
jgi:hypothetical protein